DAGPNHLQNFPTLTYQDASTDGFSLDSAPDSKFQIDFYANSLMDSSGFHQGHTYLDSRVVTTDHGGHFSGTFTHTPVPGQPYINATATLLVSGQPNDTPTDTSEFSPDIRLSHLREVNRRLLIDLDDRLSFRMARDPLFPQFLDLSFDKDTISIDPS